MSYHTIFSIDQEQQLITWLVGVKYCAAAVYLQKYNVKKMLKDANEFIYSTFKFHAHLKFLCLFWLL
jgi:hypothetical protein